MERALRERSARGGFDLEAMEFAIRDSLQRVGARFLEQLLNTNWEGRWRGWVPCDQQHASRHVGKREKTVLTVVGEIHLDREYYHCELCGQGRVPQDEALDIVGSSFSPGVRRMMARVGSKESFEEGRQDLEFLAGILVTSKQVERIAEQVGEEAEKRNQEDLLNQKEGKLDILKPTGPTLYVAMDGTGIPMVAEELEGREGKQGPAKTREAKLGCVFTQTKQDEKGRPLRDEDSTSYVGAIETAERFGPRIHLEATRRGAGLAQRVVVLGDGAPWIWNLAESYFPQATHIVDLFHARQHLADTAKLLFPSDPNRAATWKEEQSLLLDQGLIAILAMNMRGQAVHRPEVVPAVEKIVNYFETNASRMKYAEFRSQGLFVGSGVMEAGCKTIVGQRLKRSGMRWTLRGANAIIALRCLELSGRMDSFWEQRRAA
jgi:hypothetical protein